MKNNDHKLDDHKTLSFTNWCVENQTTIYIFTFIITLAGLLVYTTLPKEQFPDIKIPQVYINTVYFGTARRIWKTRSTNPSRNS